MNDLNAGMPPTTPDVYHEVTGAASWIPLADAATASPPSSDSSPHFALKDYQHRFVDSLDTEFRFGRGPWLGVAAPMQTGKSSITGPLIDRLHTEFERIVIVGDSRISTENLYSDLTGFDREGKPCTRTCTKIDISNIGLITDRKRVPGLITVGSLFGLVRHLDDFSLGPRTLVILDEAYRTQAPSVQKILSHFGLATIRDGKAHPPNDSQGNLLIGYSGTAAGLDKYRVSARRTLLESIRAGEVRHMTGEQVQMKIESETSESLDEGTMVWWKPTLDNARELAQIFRDRIHGKYTRNMVNVPTIEHAKLMFEALQEICPEGDFGLVHSGQSEDDNSEARRIWENGGTVISIRKLARSFRGTATGAIFHTYQTQSEELFAQRTGRGWRQTGNLDDLYVLESSWSGPMRFSNLANLLGLVDYPKKRLCTRTLERDLEHINKQNELERDVNDKITAGRIAPVFSALPRLMGWRDFVMQEILADEAAVSTMAISSGIPEVLISGFRHGGLPYSVDQVRALAGAASLDEDDLIQCWLESWKSVATEIDNGLRAKSTLPEWFDTWARMEGDDKTLAEELSVQLDRYIKDAFRENGKQRIPQPAAFKWFWTSARIKKLKTLLGHENFAPFLNVLSATESGERHSYLPQPQADAVWNEFMRESSVYGNWQSMDLSPNQWGFLAHQAMFYAYNNVDSLPGIGDKLFYLLLESLRWREAENHGRDKLLRDYRWDLIEYIPTLFIGSNEHEFGTRFPHTHRWILTGKRKKISLRTLLTELESALQAGSVDSAQSRGRRHRTNFDLESYYDAIIAEAGYPNLFSLGGTPVDAPVRMLDWILQKARFEYITTARRFLPLLPNEDPGHCTTENRDWLRQWLNGKTPIQTAQEWQAALYFFWRVAYEEHCGARPSNPKKIKVRTEKLTAFFQYDEEMVKVIDWGCKHFQTDCPSYPAHPYFREDSDKK